jgi:hypothetical protein
MPTRLLALAILGGKPKKIITGIEIKEPPPEITLMKPTNNPTTNKTIAFTRVISTRAKLTDN